MASKNWYSNIKNDPERLRIHREKARQRRERRNQDPECVERLREEGRNRASTRRDSAKLLVLEIKSGLECERCGQIHPATLTFRHRPGEVKLFALAEVTGKTASMANLRELVLAEIEKCDVLCANCHRRLHGFELDDRSEVKAMLTSIKETYGCRECGEKDGVCLGFHHRDPSQKLFGIGYKSGVASVSKQALLAEIEKCGVLCANCHQIEEANERGYYTSEGAY